MPKFKFVGDSPRVFPTYGFEVAPGDVVEHPENPDPHFFEPVVTKTAAAAEETK